MLPWEADMLVLSASGFLYEVEIKISIADLKRDRSKRKWSPAFQEYRATTNIRGMWFAMPESVWQHKDAEAAVPDIAGVIVINPDERPSRMASVVRRCKPNKSARALTDRERFKLARLGMMRYWTRNPLDSPAE